jgi:hypothetical protein
MCERDGFYSCEGMCERDVCFPKAVLDFLSGIDSSRCTVGYDIRYELSSTYIMYVDERWGVGYDHGTQKQVERSQKEAEVGYNIHYCPL